MSRLDHTKLFFLLLERSAGTLPAPACRRGGGATFHCRPPRAFCGKLKFLVFTTLTHAGGMSMLPHQSASSPKARPRGKLKCSRIRPLRSPNYWDVGGTETARPSILLFRSCTTNSGASPNTISATSGPDTLCKAQPWYTRLMSE